MIVLDACVLIALADPENHFHHVAQGIMETDNPLMLTAINGAELMVHPSPIEQRQWREVLQAYKVEVVDITANDMEAIAATRRETGLRMPDALVLWLAQSNNAAVASFDKQLLRKAAELGLRIITGT